MSIKSSDIAFYYSGQSSSVGIPDSIGGEPSTIPIADRLFKNVTNQESVDGTVDYKCVYMANKNPDESFYNLNLSIRNSSTSVIQFGFPGVHSSATALCVIPPCTDSTIQYLKLKSATEGISSGGFGLIYNGSSEELGIQWNVDLDSSASNLKAALETIYEFSNVVVEPQATINTSYGKEYSFKITYETGRYIDLLVVPTHDNFLTPKKTIHAGIVGNTTSNSPVVTNIASTSALFAGMVVTGGNAIPAGATWLGTIKSIDSLTQITLSEKFLWSRTAASLTFVLNLPNISIESAGVGGPVNRTTDPLESSKVAPNVNFLDENATVIIKHFYPNDYIPIWIKRTILPNTSAVDQDNFSILVSASNSEIEPTPTPTYVALDLVDQSQELYDGGLQVIPGISYWQSFNCMTTGKLSQLEFGMYSDPIFSNFSTNSTGDITPGSVSQTSFTALSGTGTIRIYTGIGINASNLVGLVSVSVNIANSLITWNNFKIDLDVTRNTTYTFAYTPDFIHKIAINYQNPYAGGLFGVNATSFPDADILFKTHVLQEFSLTSTPTMTPSITPTLTPTFVL